MIFRTVKAVVATIVVPLLICVFFCVGFLAVFAFAVAFHSWMPFATHWIAMWQNYIFGMHWEHKGRMYYDELSAESQEEAADISSIMRATMFPWCAWIWFGQTMVVCGNLPNRRFHLLRP